MSTSGIILLSSFANLDNTSAFQFMISRPSFWGAILGYFTGYITEGFILGLVVEALILDFNPVGGITIPNGTVSITVIMLLIPQVNIYSSFFIGILAGEIYAKIEGFIRQWRSRWNKSIEKEINELNLNLSKWIILSIAVEVIITSVYMYLFFTVIIFLKDYLNMSYIRKSLQIALAGTVFIILTSLYFKLKMQLRKKG